MNVTDYYGNIDGHIVVLGYPCAGKTTFARNLARVLNAEHISVGNVIRDYRKLDLKFKEQTSEAFIGREPFAATILAGPLQKEILKKGSSVIVIDAGPPIDVVFDILRTSISCVFVIDVDSATRLTRFRARKKTDERNDDELSLWQSRTTLFESELPKVIAGFEASTHVIHLDGLLSENELLCKGLRELTVHLAVAGMSKLQTNRIASKKIYSLEDHIKIHEENLRSSNSDRMIIDIEKNIEPSGQYGPSQLMLLKTGFRRSKKNFEMLENQLKKFSCRINRIGLLINNQGSNRLLFAAHFGYHFLYSYFGSQVVDIGIVSNFIRNFGNLDSIKIKSGFEFDLEYGRHRLQKSWRDFVTCCDDGSSVPRKLADYMWATFSIDPVGFCIINGHIPAMLDKLSSDQASICVLDISFSSKSSVYGDAFREAFLGPSIPAKASKDSLRGMLFHGILESAGEVSIANNGVHLSSSEDDAFKEIMIWFGDKN